MTTEFLAPSDRVADQPSQRKLWLAAIKPPMYSVAVIPIWLGTAAAIAETHHANWTVFGLFLLSAILIVAWSNVSNDVFDADTGIDRNKPHSVVNLTGNRPLMFWLSNLLLALGIGGILTIAYWQKDWTVIGLILACCALGYSYQGPPFRFGYQGLGEILCFFAYGPFAIGAVYYSQTGAWSTVGLPAWLTVALFNGITTSLILFCSHFHQLEDDAAAGKQSPIVRLGTLRAAQLLPWISVSIYVPVVVATLLGILPYWTLLTLASLPLAIKLCRFILANHSQPSVVKNCKFIAVGLHFLSGLLLGVGLVL